MADKQLRRTMETAKKITKFALMGLGGFLIFAVIMGMLFGEDTPVAAPTTMAVTVTAPTEATTTTSTSTTTTTRPRITTTTTERELTRAEIRTVWIIAVSQESLNYPGLTWADRMPDNDMLEILDIACGAFADGSIDPTSDTSIATFVTLFQELYAPDWWTFDDSLLLSFGIGAATYPGLCP